MAMTHEERKARRMLRYYASVPPTYRLRKIARSSAIKAGVAVFDSPTPCRFGHLGMWRTKENTCVQCNADRNAAWHAKNKLRNNEARRLDYLANRDAELAANERWAAANRDKVNATERNRRARKKASIGQHTADDIAALRRQQRNKCAYCRASVKGSLGHVDHILPLALGGGNGRENLQILCQPCNSSKGAKHPIEFAQRIGRLL